MSANSVADKFGYEFHGGARNYLKIAVSGTTTPTFQIGAPSTIVIWLYILNQDEIQYLYCKSFMINSYHRPKFCVFIKDGYYWGELQNQQLQTETPVDSGWTMLVVQLQDTTETYPGNIKTQMQIITYNGKWRHLSDAVQFDLRYSDQDNFITYFGGRPVYNFTTSRDEIYNGFDGYMIQIKLYNSIQTLTQLDSLISCKITNKKQFLDYCTANSNYESCDLCRAQDSNKCLVYDDLTTANGLLVSKYSFDNYFDANTNKQIVKDYGPSLLYHLQRGKDTTADDRDPSLTTYYGLYFLKNTYLKMNTLLDLDKDFTIDFYLRMDQIPIDDESYLFTKTYIQNYYANNTFMSGQHYYGFSFARTNNSAYFFINNTNYKQYCQTWFPNFIDTDQDLKEWLYISVSVSQFSDYSTNVCVYKRGWNVFAQCQVLLCQMSSHSQYQSWYIGGKSLKGAIRTMYIWNYAKALNVMNFSPLLGLVNKDDEQSVETKGDCNAFDPDKDQQFLGYCSLCDKYNGMADQSNMCFSPCAFNLYDSLCKQKCRNDLCESCLGGSTYQCQVCKTGAEMNDVSSECECIYSDYYLASDQQSCLECHINCDGCYGGNYTDCYDCESGFIPVTDIDQCGTGVCCFSSCQEYSRVYYYNFLTNRCIYCGAGKYSLDGYTCTEMVFASIDYLLSDMSQLKIKFTRPIIHSLDYDKLKDKFQIIISGPRDSYIIQYSLDEQSFPKDKYSSTMTFTLGVQSTLYGIETLKLIFGEFTPFTDADGIPFGGPSNLETSTFTFSFLSATDQQTTQKAGSLATQSSFISLIVILVIQTVAGGSVEALFCLFYMMQIVSIFPLMNLYFPSNAVSMFKSLAFVNVNNEYLSALFKRFFYTDSDFSDQNPLNDNYNKVGMGSKNMFMNSPDQLLVWIMIFIAYPFILFAKYMFSHLGPIFKMFIEIENSYHFNGMIKTFQQIQLTMLIGSLVNILFVNPVTSADYASFYGSYIFIFISGFLTIFSVVFVILQKDVLSHKNFQHTWGSLILNGELKLKQPQHYIYLWTFLVRRTLFAVTLVVFKDSPRLQLLIYIASSCFIFLWHLVLQPFQSQLLNFFNVFNELVLIICGCISILFLDASIPEAQANLYGYLMIVVVVLAIIINWGVILPSKVVEGIESMRTMIRNRDDKIRYQIEKKYLMFDSEFDQGGDLVIEQRINSIKLKSNGSNKNRRGGRKHNDNSKSVLLRRNLFGFNDIQDDGDTNENSSKNLMGRDYFPINRVDDDLPIIRDELNSIREAAKLDEYTQAALRNERIPIMDPRMKKKKSDYNKMSKINQPKYVPQQRVMHQIELNFKGKHHDKEDYDVLRSIDAIDITELAKQRGISQQIDNRDRPMHKIKSTYNNIDMLKVGGESLVPIHKAQDIFNPKLNLLIQENDFTRPYDVQNADADLDIGIAYDANQQININLQNFTNQRFQQSTTNIEQQPQITQKDFPTKPNQNLQVYDLF